MDPAPQTVDPLRRVARTIVSQSPQGVVLHVVRDALAPGWSLASSSRRLIDYVKGDVSILQRARERLLASMRERVTMCQTRALATLDEAIETIERSGRVSRGDGEPG